MSAVTGFVSISDDASLVSTLIGTVNSAVWSKICAKVAGTKKFKSITKKKRKKRKNIVLLAKLIQIPLQA